MPAVIKNGVGIILVSRAAAGQPGAQSSRKDPIMAEPTVDADAALPYRANVGAVLFNAAGRVFVGRRVDAASHGADGPAWQLPQGGIDADEDPDIAVLRELAEEVGTDKAEIIGRHPEWLQYDFPPELLGRVMGGHYRGQRQLWYALRFLGDDTDIRLDADKHPEFDAFRWVTLDELPALAVPFKRPIYKILARDFVPYSQLAAAS
jgi:putative (di)nucleoside polyphosphate hydrolase